MAATAQPRQSVLNEPAEELVGFAIGLFDGLELLILASNRSFTEVKAKSDRPREREDVQFDSTRTIRRHNRDSFQPGVFPPVGLIHRQVRLLRRHPIVAALLRESSCYCQLERRIITATLLHKNHC